MIDYLDWQSDLSLEQVFAASDPFSYPTFADINGESQLLYLSQQTKEAGRITIMHETEGELPSLTAEFSLRTKISEYGGKPYWVCGRSVIFANLSDQCLYEQSLTDLSAPPRRVSPAFTHPLMYSDVSLLGDSQIIAIVEDARADNESYLAQLNLNQPDTVPLKLAEGADFYSNLVVDTHRQRLAWVQWNHPFMPWDSNQLWVADYQLDDDSRIILSNKQRVDLNDESCCVCQVLFASNGRLFFSADFAHTDNDSARNYWNIYAYDIAEKRLAPVTQRQQEFGYPHWVYGDHRIAQFNDTCLVTIASDPLGDTLFSIDQQSLAVDTLNCGGLPAYVTFKSLVADACGQAAVIMQPVDKNPSLIRVHGGMDNLVQHTIIASTPSKVTVSLAQHIEFPTRDGERAYGFYYPAANDLYHDASGAPPLIVMVHGGPTSRAYGSFDIQKQFWTSRGFALFDVNHRGSSGYGRHFRDALYEHWGERDAADIIDGVTYLVKQGMADEERLCIRGKSAGGYAVLRALTEYPDVFKAGACYYGIGNLATLAEATHKFEKYYTDRLVGEKYDAHTASAPNSAYYQRSPVHKLAELKSAMIVFQGLQDKVVPPSVAQEVIEVLKTAELEYAYVEYSDEGHGFRQAVNNIDAWGKELAFYHKVLRR